MNFMAFLIRQIRVLWVGYFAIVGLYIWAVAQIPERTSDGRITGWHWAMAALAVYSALVGYLFRRKIMAQAAAEASKGNAAAARKRWATAQLVALNSALAVVFVGGFARMLACPLLFASVFYLAGVVLLICFKPAKQPV